MPKPIHIQSTNAQIQDAADKAVQAVAAKMEIKAKGITDIELCRTCDKPLPGIDPNSRNPQPQMWPELRVCLGCVAKMAEYDRKRPPYTPIRGWVECKSEDNKGG